MSAVKSTREKKSAPAQRRWLAPANLAIVLGACVIALYMLYPALQEWWADLRYLQLLEAESAALDQRNAMIDQQIEALDTPEGIESRAREQYGWVMPGEHAINILGLSSEDSSTALPDSIAPGSVHPEIDWLTEALDFLFGFEYPQPPPASDDVIIGL